MLTTLRLSGSNKLWATTFQCLKRCFKKIRSNSRKDQFKASSRWLLRFKIRHNINQATVCGENKSVNMPTVENWKAKLPEIIADHDAKDIFNMN